MPADLWARMERRQLPLAFRKARGAARLCARFHAGRSTKFRQRTSATTIAAVALANGLRILCDCRTSEGEKLRPAVPPRLRCALSPERGAVAAHRRHHHLLAAAGARIDLGAGAKAQVLADADAHFAQSAAVAGD